jgi:hypothetical protein
MSRNMKNRVNPQRARPSYEGKSQNMAYLRCGTKSPFDIMEEGEGVSRTSDAHIENEIRLHVAMRLRSRGVGAIPPQCGPQRTVPFGERVRATESESLYRPLRQGSRRTRRTLHGTHEESHRLPAIALTRIIPSPYRASRGFGAPLKR